MSRNMTVKCDGCGCDLSGITQEYITAKPTAPISKALGLCWDYCTDCWGEMQKALGVDRWNTKEPKGPSATDHPRITEG